jgi:hypothetical protein
VLATQKRPACGRGKFCAQRGLRLDSRSGCSAEATAAGEITPGEAASFSMLVGNVAKAMETFELSARLAKLEEPLAAKGGPA